MECGFVGIVRWVYGRIKQVSGAGGVSALANRDATEDRGRCYLLDVVNGLDRIAEIFDTEDTRQPPGQPTESGNHDYQAVVIMRFGLCNKYPA